MGQQEKCPKQKNNRNCHHPQFKDTDEMEATQILNSECKIMIIRILKDLTEKKNGLSQ